MIVLRTEEELRELLAGETSTLRDPDGEFREPPCCRRCGGYLVPQLGPSGVEEKCPDCDAAV